MKSYIRIVLLPVLLVYICHVSCSKESAAASSAAGAGGSLAKFAIIGNYLYLLGDGHYVSTYDITHPELPKSLGNTFIGYDLETIFPYRDKLYLGASNGLYVVSVKDPAHPVMEGSITHFTACDPVVSNDSVSYVTLRAGNSCGSTKNVLNIYDSKKTTDPKLIKEVAMTSPYGLGINGQALYVCEGANGLSVFDLADPYNPKRLQTLNDEVYYDVIPYGNVLIAWTNAGLAFFDVSDPLHITKAGELKD